MGAGEFIKGVFEEWVRIADKEAREAREREQKKAQQAAISLIVDVMLDLSVNAKREDLAAAIADLSKEDFRILDNAVSGRIVAAEECCKSDPRSHERNKAAADVEAYEKLQSEMRLFRYTIASGKTAQVSG